MFALMLVLSVAIISVSAEEEASYQYMLDDSADVLTDTEEGQLSETLSLVCEKCQCNLLFVTENSLPSTTFYYDGTAEDFAKCYYNDTFGVNSDGVVVSLMLSDQDGDRNLSIYGTGKCEKRLSNSESEDIRTDATTNHKPEDTGYYDFFNSIANGLEKAIPPHVSFLSLLIAIGIGFAIAMIIMLILKSQLKSVKPEHGAANYVRPGSMNVTASRDSFLYRTVNRTAKPKNNSSSSSSSGGSFSGGSTKF